jgi:hypothetical protein
MSPFKPTNIFKSIERSIEGGLEGGLGRLLGARLQPVAVAKAAARAMEASRSLGPDGTRVANRYRLGLHASDYRRFLPYQESLARDVEHYLDAEARRMAARPVDVWVVEVFESGNVRPGRVDVLVDAVDVATRASFEHAPGVDDTQRLSAIHARVGATQARLVIGEQAFPLTKSVTTIGRALDNDIVIADSRVSRYHAQLEAREGGFRVRDLASTNGTLVRGTQVGEQELSAGEEVSFGGVVARLEAAEASRG